MIKLNRTDKIRISFVFLFILSPHLEYISASVYGS